MKLRKEMIDYLAHRLVDDLGEKELLDVGDEVMGVEETVSAVIMEDLQVEDLLNQEVKNLLDAMGDEIDSANINYRKMFQMVKMKLARERGLIL